MNVGKEMKLRICIINVVLLLHLRRIYKVSVFRPFWSGFLRLCFCIKKYALLRQYLCKSMFALSTVSRLLCIAKICSKSLCTNDESEISK